MRYLENPLIFEINQNTTKKSLESKKSQKIKNDFEPHDNENI